MTRTEHLLCIMAEECAEVAQRISKALRFGLEEVQPGQPLNNLSRIAEEWHDLMIVAGMVEDECGMGYTPSATEEDAKVAKIEKFLAYSKECGTLATEED